MAIKNILCTVQMQWKVSDYKSPQAFFKKIDSIMEKIRLNIGSDSNALVAFPEDVGTPLVFMNAYDRVKNAKTLTQAVQLLIREYFLKILFYRIRYKAGWFRALALVRAKDMTKVYMDVFSKMAKKYGVYLVAGSTLSPDFKWNRDIEKISYHIMNNKVYNSAFLFNPDGEQIGMQKKTHLVPDLEDSGGFDLCEGSVEELKVFDTSLGKVGIAVCLDCFKEPVIKALVKKGAQILIQPSANCKVWNKEEQEGWIEGCQQAMEKEKTFRYALNPMMTGCLFDLCFEGQSSILANRDEETKELGYKDLEPATGFINVAKTHTGEELLFMEI